ncbi:amino acid ABC transporter ATP-binding protein [Loigolactobacillus coryniformis]|jgi:polar amino acid transport system ATP-binding protein|uniref:Glutamine ABC transporter, ATP-binding protein n=2 Tax=Loigolactobacillus coryniformis TaxID=1610 RepID=A0A0R1FC78_9LACO|nr:amino acid ABC transporter ATP-binding protein [Loigolactobacillus coryniformis]MDT3390779.1 amino acid ABC transporter ATP-binding protein [Bacillota bacterium]OEH90221.1 polar amino acid ABC transporter ATP-binding protein [Loigolactobacillus coryniformis subsp. coryniformis]ATO43562.1 polar amino acid ABC transporter ATP-binding protein [Loigolactobacillus coryniformis subsp. torquens DSM 20004 = KCTC 3535]ATO55240.1 polar amino acid ABC transporter ATP-binding protein [Loigolactobacillus
MLELKAISKYYGRRLILDQLDLTVNDGEVLAIVGPSGAGKTTLLRCISGLERIDSGQILLDGQAFDPFDNQDKDSVIGVVFQDFQLFPNLSVLDNITLAPMLALKQTKDAAEKQARALLERLALTGKETLYPYQLSGGQKQRVALARALAMKPKILCYDEPTSALDPDLRQEVEKLILGLKADGMTQIVVTHDLEFAENIADAVKRVEALPEK